MPLYMLFRVSDNKSNLFGDFTKGLLLLFVSCFLLISSALVLTSSIHFEKLTGEQHMSSAH